MGAYFLAQFLSFVASPPATGFDQLCQTQSMVVINELRSGGSQSNPSVLQKFRLLFTGNLDPKSPPPQLQCPNLKMAHNQSNPGGGNVPKSSTTLSSKPNQSEY